MNDIENEIILIQQKNDNKKLKKREYQRMRRALKNVATRLDYVTENTIFPTDNQISDKNKIKSQKKSLIMQRLYMSNIELNIRIYN